ncbi:MAG: hypothetical protein WBN22_11800 [Verrucomicrobiia bacterium]
MNNNLYMGFQNSGGGGTVDYIINLGAASNIVGQSSVVDISSAFSSSLFNSSSLQGTSRQIWGGVVAASAAQNPSDVYGTQLRTSNFGNPAVAGSLRPNNDPSLWLDTAQDTTAAQNLSTLAAPTAGTGALDGSKSWETLVEPNIDENSFYYYSVGFNPDSPVSTNTVLYEDLWETSDSSSSRGDPGQPFVYVGYFTLDLTGASPKLTFTSTNVPASLTTQPVIVSIQKAGSTVTVVSSNAVPPFNYQLQYTASLNPTNWANVGSSVVAGSTLVTNTDTTATSTNRFYRVQGQ